MTDAFVAFWSGLLCGMIVGVFIFAVIVAIRSTNNYIKLFEEMRAAFERRDHDDE